ncbi:DUF3800 domain-containing protein [Candidatus Woesearchaeota archaeon]|nr:DUF3800 domain-containing protein [Candidatus Woesearchaeota archaeon]
MFNYIYIDESGDLGLNGSKYLILSALMIEDNAKLDRIIKNMRRNKFRKQLKKAYEIKANKSSEELIKYMLTKLNELKSVRIIYMVLEKKKITSEFLKNNRNKLYNYVAGKLAKQIKINKTYIEIKIDKSKGKQILREDFDNYFLKNFEKISKDRKIIIQHSYSHSWSGLQFADILAWSCFQKFEHNNISYINLIDQEKEEVYHVW